MALAITARGTGNTGSGATRSASPNANMAAGSTAVLCIALDNMGGSGGSAGAVTICDASMQDSAGNTWTRRLNVLFDNGAAGAGVEIAIYTGDLRSALGTGGSVVVGFGGISVTSAAWTLWEVTAGAAKRAAFIASAGGTGTAPSGGTTGVPSITTSSITSGDAVFGVCGAESSDTFAGDADTSSGSWTTHQHAVQGSGTSGMSVSSQGKVVTGTATQTYNPTLTSADTQIGWLQLREVNAYTMVAGQGSYAYTGQTTIAFARTRKLVVPQGAYALSGTSPTLTYTPVAGFTFRNESFNAADAALTTGNWSTCRPGFPMAIVSNKATYAAGDSTHDAAARYSGITWPNDQWSEAKLTNAGSSGGAGCGVTVRCDPGGAYTCYRLVVSADNYWEIYKFIAGAFTFLTSGTNLTYVAGQIARLQVIGSTLTAFYNGVQVGTTTDTAITSGQPGIAYSSTNAGATADDWQGSSAGIASTLPTGLSSWWSMDETSGNRADSKGSNTLTPSASLGSAAAPQGNCAGSFGGSISLVAAEHSSLEPNNTDFTFSAWVFFLGGGYQVISGKWKDTGPNYSWLLWLNGSTGKYEFYVSPNGTTPLTVVASTASAPITTWHNIVVWNDTAAGKIRLQLNASFGSGPGSIDEASHTGGAYNAAGVPMRLGNSEEGPNFLGGYLDECAFWKRKLTDTERALLWNSGYGIPYIPATGAGAYTLAAGQGAFTLTGQATGLLRSRIMPAGQGAFAYTGQTTLALRRGFMLTLPQGGYSLGGQAVTLLRTRIMVAAFGVFALTGQTTIALLRGRRLTLTKGDYALNGQPVLFQLAHKITLPQGSYTYTGQTTIKFLRTRIMPAAFGAFALTGQTTIAFLKGRTITAGQGAYTYTGQTTIALKFGRNLITVFGSYALTGKATAFLRGLRLIAPAGNYALNGQAVNFGRGRIFTLVQGAYTLAGQAVAFLRSRIMGAPFGSYALNGQAAGLLRGRRAILAQGLYLLTGTSPGLLKGSRITLPAGAYAYTGTAPGLRVARKISPPQGSYLLNGQPVAFIYSPAGHLTMIAGQGAYSLNGQAVNFRRTRIFGIPQGSYLYTGQSVAFLKGRTITVPFGSYALNGQAAAFIRSRNLLAGAGAFTLTGKPIVLLRGRIITTPFGSYILTGQPVGMIAAHNQTLIASRGLFALTGFDVEFPLAGLGDRKLTAHRGYYTLTGRAVGLIFVGIHIYPPVITVDAGNEPIEVDTGAGGLNVDATTGLLVIDARP